MITAKNTHHNKSTYKLARRLKKVKYNIAHITNNTTDTLEKKNKKNTYQQLYTNLNLITVPSVILAKEVDNFKCNKSAQTTTIKIKFWRTHI